MATDAALVARMEVRLNDFERKMKQASGMAGNAVNEIEQKFSRANPSLSGSFLKGLLGAQLIGEAVRLLDDFNKRLKAIGDTAKLTGLSMKEVWALQDVGSSQGAKAGEITKGLEGLGEKLNEARRQSNDLSELFEANGEKIRDAAGNVIPLQRALEIVAELVRTAATEFDKIEIAKLAGLSREWVKVLEGGAEALAQAKRKAIETSPEVDELAKSAASFDAAWQKAGERLGIHIKAGLMNAAGAIGGFFSLLKTRMDQSGITKAFEDHFDREMIGQGYDPNTRKRLDALPVYGPEIPPGFAVNQAASEVRRRESVSVLPTKSAKSGGGGGGSSGVGSDPARYFEDEMRRMRERAQQLELETRLIGKSTEEREKALAVLELEQALQRGGVAISDAHRRKIEDQAGAYAKVADAAERAREQQRQNQELQQFVGQEMVSIFSDLARGTATFEEAVKRLADRLLEASLQALVLGQGPLATLFGTGGTGGNLGGLVGALFGGGRASGGPVQSGKTYVVGENGPELVRFGRNGSIVPNGLVKGEGGGGMLANVTLINQTSQPSAVASTRRRGNDVELIIRDLEDGVAGRAARGRGSLAPALSGPASRRG